MARFGALGGRGRPPKGGIGAVFFGGLVASCARCAAEAELPRGQFHSAMVSTHPPPPPNERLECNCPWKVRALPSTNSQLFRLLLKLFTSEFSQPRNLSKHNLLKIPYTTLTPPTARHASHHPLLAGGSAAARPRTRRTRRWWTARATCATARAAARSAASALSAATTTWPTAAVIAAPTAARSTARAKSVGRTTAGTRTRRQGALAEAQFERHRRPESSERC